MIDIYFFDSYAAIEILKGNPSYLKYKRAGVVTTKLNLFEVAYYLLREHGEEKAIDFLNKNYDLTVDFNKDTLSKAIGLKYKLKERKLSMADCIGYTLANQLKLQFLTGDKEFKDLENVEFVK